MSRICGTHGVRRSAYGVLVGKGEGKRPLGRRRPKLEDNIKMSVIRIKLAENRHECQFVTETAVNIRVP